MQNHHKGKKASHFQSKWDRITLHNYYFFTDSWFCSLPSRSGKDRQEAEASLSDPG